MLSHGSQQNSERHFIVCHLQFDCLLPWVECVPLFINRLSYSF